MYDNLEPTVVDEELLKSAVEEQGPKEEAGKIAKSEGIDFGDVKALRLDFKSNKNYCNVHKHVIAHFKLKNYVL